MAEEGRTGADVVLSRFLTRVKSGVELLKPASAGLCMRRACVAKLRVEPVCEESECGCLVLATVDSSDIRR